jgi:dihydrofolate reductase
MPLGLESDNDGVGRCWTAAVERRDAGPHPRERAAWPAARAVLRSAPFLEGGSPMAKFVFGMNQSLDGYVDHEKYGPDDILFRHFTDHIRGLSGSLYGRRLYETMRYWDEDDPEWSTDLRDFAEAWRKQPKWVVSRSLKAVGPNATLIQSDLAEAAVRLRREYPGEIDVGGPELAQALGALGLIDEYRIYLHPVVLGAGKPYFAGARPPLRLLAHDRIGEQVIRLTFVPD